MRAAQRGRRRSTAACRAPRVTTREPSSRCCPARTWPTRRRATIDRWPVRGTAGSVALRGIAAGLQSRRSGRGQGWTGRAAVPYARPIESAARDDVEVDILPFEKIMRPPLDDTETRRRTFEMILILCGTMKLFI